MRRSKFVAAAASPADDCTCCFDRRHFLTALLAAAPVAALSATRAVAQAQPIGPGLPATEQGRIDELVLANQILADQQVLDGFGHISVRSANTPAHYLMSRSQAPGLVTADDIMEHDENNQPVDARGRRPIGERFIHGEIYRVRPGVMSVVHSHTAAVLPFGVTKAPLKAMIHTAYFLGVDPAPIFDIRDALGENNMVLVDIPKAGAALAQTLGNRSVVLMRGHGMAVAAPSTRDAVFRAIYTKVDAEAELEALKLGDPQFLNRYEVTRSEAVSTQWNLWAAQAQATRSAAR